MTISVIVMIAVWQLLYLFVFFSVVLFWLFGIFFTTLSISVIYTDAILLHIYALK